MALSKLNPLFLLHPQNLLPIPRSHPHPQRLRLLPFKNPSDEHVHLRAQLLIPKLPLKTSTAEAEAEYDEPSYFDSDSLSVAFPSVAFSNTLFFSSAYNVQVIVGDQEPEDKLIGRFRREVLRAGVIQECKRRRFFETSQEKKKRKARDAAKRNRKRRRPPVPKASKPATQETSSKKKTQARDSDDDNWDWDPFDQVDLPYC